MSTETVVQSDDPHPAPGAASPDSLNIPSSNDGSETDSSAIPIVRRATRADVQKITDLINSFPSALLPRKAEEIESLIDTFWLAHDAAGNAVGCCCLEVYSPKIAEVRSLAVKPEYRRQGVGQRLVAHAVAEGKARGIREIFAVTSSVDFFSRIGFCAALNNEKYALFYNG